MNKFEIRKNFRKKRSDLSSDFVLSSSNLICQNVIKNFAEILDKKKLAFYIPINNEVDPQFLMNFFSKKNQQLALPKIEAANSKLSFKEYRFGESLQSSKIYTNILEPNKNNLDIIPDIVFVPLVAFDENCCRIGMGGGFYDRTISFFRKNNSQIKFIGLAYEIQFCKDMQKDDTDQSLDFVVSETKVFSRHH